MTGAPHLDFQVTSPSVLASGALRDAAVRHRISAAAVSLFMKLSDQWRLSISDRLALLGDISRSTYYNWHSGKVGTLSRDQLERISLVLGIHKGLKLLFADHGSATRWLTSPNKDLPFGGLSPLDRALRGSVDDLYAVRRYLEAWRAMN